MTFLDIFKDDNAINEKCILGFLSFGVMVLVMATDLISGVYGKDLPINEFVYNSFIFITLGSFGISGIEKFARPPVNTPPAPTTPAQG